MSAFAFFSGELAVSTQLGGNVVLTLAVVRIPTRATFTFVSLLATSTGLVRSAGRRSRRLISGTGRRAVRTATVLLAVLSLLALLAFTLVFPVSIVEFPGELDHRSKGCRFANLDHRVLDTIIETVVEPEGE